MTSFRDNYNYLIEQISGKKEFNSIIKHFITLKNNNNCTDPYPNHYDNNVLPSDIEYDTFYKNENTGDLFLIDNFFLSIGVPYKKQVSPVSHDKKDYKELVSYYNINNRRGYQQSDNTISSLFYGLYKIKIKNIKKIVLINENNVHKKYNTKLDISKCDLFLKIIHRLAINTKLLICKNVTINTIQHLPKNIKTIIIDYMYNSSFREKVKINNTPFPNKLENILIDNIYVKMYYFVSSLKSFHISNPKSKKIYNLPNKIIRFTFYDNIKNEKRKPTGTFK